MQKLKDGWKCLRETVADSRARVEADGAAMLLLFEDRARNDVARRQLGLGMHARA